MSKCECIDCSECDGSGRVWFTSSGKYRGKLKGSDMDEWLHCPECMGAGVVETCDHCLEEEQYYYENPEGT